MEVHSRGDGSRVRIQHVADDEIVSCRERRVWCVRVVFVAPNEVLRLEVANHVLHPSAGHPDLIEER